MASEVSKPSGMTVSLRARNQFSMLASWVVPRVKQTVAPLSDTSSLILSLSGTTKAWPSK